MIIVVNKMYEVCSYKPQIVNKAFSSLSFRGKKGYAPNSMMSRLNSNKKERQEGTYGGILCVSSPEGTKYALVQGRYTSKWSFPKGHANEGETPLECTKREIAEETGLDNLPKPLNYMKMGYGGYYIFDFKEEPVLKPRDEKEIMDTKWVLFDEMEKMSLNADVSLFRKTMLKVREISKS